MKTKQKLSAAERYRLALEALRSEPGLVRHGTKRAKRNRLTVATYITPKNLKLLRQLADCEQVTFTFTFTDLS